MLRLSKAGDAEGILVIYAPYIKTTSFTFETEVPSVENFKERIAAYMVNYPWLVCEIGGRIAGYAYSASHRERKAYQWSVESSVYIHNDYQKRGIASALYNALIEILKLQGFRNVYAVINLPNDKSVAFHESCGFKYFATYEQVGYKLGKWKNVGWWRLIINEFENDPSPPLKFSEIDQTLLPEIFSAAEKFIKK
ncbi:MAG: N-acetyltransferase [Sphingobacteriales bacterium]|nr:N-acetyltransferase [Sphingobacteriales bacterium]